MNMNPEHIRTHIVLAHVRWTVIFTRFVRTIWVFEIWTEKEMIKSQVIRTASFDLPIPVFHFSNTNFMYFVCEGEESIPHQLHERMMKKKYENLTRKCRVSSWNWKMNEINSKIRQRVYGKSDTVPGCVCIQCMCAKTAVPTIPCYTLWMTKMGQKKDDRIKIDQKFKKRNKETREPACQPISQQKKLSKTDCYLSISPLSSPFKCLQIRLQTNID